MNVILCASAPEEAQYCQQRIGRLSEQYRLAAEIQIKQTCNQVLFDETALACVDVIYLGVAIAEQDGLELALELRQRGFNADIVFYTDDESRVFDAFDVEALHYLVRGQLADEKFDRVFLKAADRAKRRKSSTIMFSCAGEKRRVALHDIHYFEVRNRIITVYYQGGQFEFYSTISRLEEALFGRGFIRIHRSFLVARAYIAAVLPGEVRMQSGAVLPVGARYAGNLYGEMQRK